MPPRETPHTRNPSVASAVGVQSAALYRYFPTKEDLLFDLMRRHMEALIASWDAVRPAAADPVARLSAFVDNHIRFHVERRHSTHVSNMELRSLSKDRLSQILRLRGSGVWEGDLSEMRGDPAPPAKRKAK